ncbi:MAG: hypothetical protein RL291_173 [Pseudomonadota bacterium]|jgi:hypothetical protein
MIWKPPQPPEVTTRSPWRRRIVYAALGLIAGGLAYVALVVVPSMTPRAKVAAGYMARVACACHFIGGRSLDSCATDKEAGMELVRLSADPAQRRVTAYIPVLARASATHTPGLGCVLDR